MNCLDRLSNSLSSLKSALSRFSPQPATEVEQPTTSNESSYAANADMQPVKITEYTGDRLHYMDSGCLISKYWLVVSVEKRGTSYRVMARNNLGTTLLTTLKATDNLYVPVVKETNEVEAIEVLSEQTAVVAANNQLTVEKNRSGFKAKLGSYMLTCYGSKNTELWEAGSDGIYRPCTKLKAIQDILEQLVDKVTPKRLERAYNFVTGKAKAFGISLSALDSWFSQLQPT